MNNYKGITAFVDAFVVFLNICSPYTLLPCFLFTAHLGVNCLIIAGLTLVYFFARFRKVRMPKDSAFLIFVILFGFNLIVGYFQNTLAVGFIAIYVANIVFFSFLYNLYYDYHTSHDSRESLLKVSRGYIWLCAYQLVIVALMLIMTDGLHLFSPYQNNLDYKYDILFDNVDHLGNSYYFPLHLSVMSVGGIDKVPFFHTYGTFHGIFHEPHTMTFFVLPFLFLVHGMRINKKLLYVINVLFIIYILAAVSVTNMVCTLFVLSIWLCLKKRKATVIIVPLIVLSLITLWLYSDNPLIQLIQTKSDGSSASYSSNTLQFAFTPKTLFGSNFLDLSYVDNLQYANVDVGFVVFILNITFLAIMFYRIAKLCLSKNKFHVAIGLMGLYFFSHASKLALRTYSLEMLMFIMILIMMSYKECYSNGKIKPHKIII